MFEKVPLTIKIIVIINIMINLLLLIPWYFILRWIGNFVYVIGLATIIANIILGFGVISLKNWARISFIIMQIVSLVLSIWPFLYIFTLGMNGGSFGDRYVVSWGSPFTPLFWRQLISFTIGMSFPIIPMVFSVFCVFYLLRFKVKEQFK